MRICDFSYHRPTSLAEAFELAASLGEGTLFLAGGTDLVPDFKRGADSARHLIALQALPGLREIREDADVLRIGAMARIQEVADSALVQAWSPALAEAASMIGAVQIRRQGTIGGNFCRAVSCADTPPPALVARAQVQLASAEGERAVPADEFFTGPRKTVRRPGEVMVALLIPASRGTSGGSYQRFSLRQGSALAVASVAAWVALEGERITDARVALGAVGPVPILALKTAESLKGQPPSEEVFARVARTAAQESLPISDIRGSEAYRRKLVEVLTMRALREAVERGSRA